MVCWARRPGGVLVSIRGPVSAAFACESEDGAHPGARATSNAVAAPKVTARWRARRLLISLAGRGNVEHDLEFQGERASRHWAGPVSGMGFDVGSTGPRSERFIELPVCSVCYHEVAVFTTTGIPLGYRAPRWLFGPSPRPGKIRRMSTDLLTHRGGRGEPLILVHGLMGRGTTWMRQLPWLTQLGAVYTYDAPWHRGRDVVDPYPISTERFVADLGDAVAALGVPARLVGHSMGALHSWCLAAEQPDLVSALVLEDMAPDFRGYTTGPWEPWLHTLPDEFDSAEQIFAEFGPFAGQYFLEAFDRTATGWRLHGSTLRWIEIAAEWGVCDYWAQWRIVRSPTLLIEAGDSVTPPGQMREMAKTDCPTTYLLVPEAGHLVHDEAPLVYRRAVESFLVAT